MTELVEPAARGMPALAPGDRARRGRPLEFGLGAGAGPSCEVGRRVRQRALLLWPRLDPARLARTSGDPQRVARLVARRSALPPEVIVGMLMAAGDLD